MRPTFLAALPLLVAACGPIVQVGAPAAPPASLLTLTATGQAASPAGLQAMAETEAVSLIAATAPATLTTTRIPVLSSDTEIQYLKGAQWTEPPARLFMRLVADTLHGAGVLVIDRRVAGRSADRILGGELGVFHVDVRGSPMVRVRFDATLTGPDGVRQRRFEREVMLGSTDPVPVSRALNAAANAVAADIAQWVGQARGAGQPPPRG
ncbi:MAG: ABC-type transport auxiliary lipoprotein family protein [Sphingomonadaceae bacterium]